MALSWTELHKLTNEVIAPDGPGSGQWQAEGSVTQQVNETLMKAFRENGGKVPGELEDLPLCIVTTVGARSGKRRPVPLAYQMIEGRLLIIASMGGASRNPPWFHNLVDNPEVVVELGGETFDARATVTEGADRDRLFARICENMPVFADYQRRTERVIPVIELKRI